MEKQFFDSFFEFANKDNNVIQLRKIHNVKNIFPEEGRYIAQGIVENIKAKLRHRKFMQISYLGIDIDLYVTGTTEDEVKRYMKRIAYVVCVYFKFIKDLYGLTLPKTLCLNVFLTKLKKKLPGKDQDLTPFHVNTGYTYSDIIVIYRKEELFKVLIHEMTHFLHLDSAHISDRVMTGLQQVLKINNDLHLFEAITDFWSCYVNVMLFACMKFNGDDYNEYAMGVKRLLQKEIRFIINQSIKVIDHYDRCTQTSSVIVEKTHITAYYIVKATMFANFSKYIKDYIDWRTKEIFNDNIIDDVETFMGHQCKYTMPPTSSRSLRMSSVDVDAQMKTI